MYRLIACLVAILLTAACGGASSTPAQRSQPSYRPPPVSTGAATRGDSDEALVSREAAPAPAAAGPSFARKRKAAQKPAGGSPSAGPDYAELDRKLVKNASLTIQVKDEKHFENAIARGVEIARELEGYVTRQGSDWLIFKVPSGRLDEALAALKQLGKVKDREITTQDVTANYVDLQIRIDNLKKLRARLQELVEQGQTVEEILEVEKELGRVTSKLETLEGQMRVLNNQTTYATVTVSLTERVMPGPLGWVFYGTYHAVKWLFVWD